MNQQNQPRIIRNLQNQVNNLIQERNHFRQQFQISQQENRDLNVLARDRRVRIANLQRANDQLQQQNQRLSNQLDNFIKPKLVKRNWDDITCQTRRKRKAEYHSMFDGVIGRISECKKAKLSLRLGQDNVNFQWSLQDMNEKRNVLRNQGHRVRDPVILPDDEEDMETDPNNVANKKKKTSSCSSFDG